MIKQLLLIISLRCYRGPLRNRYETCWINCSWIINGLFHIKKKFKWQTSSRIIIIALKKTKKQQKYICGVLPTAQEACINPRCRGLMPPQLTTLWKALNCHQLIQRVDNQSLNLIPLYCRLFLTYFICREQLYNELTKSNC